MYFHKPVKQASEDVEEAVEYGSIRLHGKFKLMKKMEKQISTQMALKHRNGYIIKKSMFKKKKKEVQNSQAFQYVKIWWLILIIN
jgi:hypothetical protein